MEYHHWVYLVSHILLDFFVFVFTVFFLRWYFLNDSSSKKVHIDGVTEYSRQWQLILCFYFQIKFIAYRSILDAFIEFNQT